MPQIWVLVLLCQCVQPSQTLFVSREACVAQGKLELDALNTVEPVVRCVQVPR